MFDTGNNHYWQDHQVPWPCWRLGNLVYFPHNKCASTLYDLLFLRLGWQRTDTQTMDWHSDQVFSHIREPLTKHYKGLVEGLTFFPEVMTFFATAPGDTALAFLTHVVSIDPHSYSIHRYLGDNALRVTWIPIDTDINHQQATFDFLAARGVVVDAEIQQWFLSLGKVNAARPHEEELYQRLIRLPTQPDVLRYIDFDICLYDSIARQDFEPAKYPDRIQQLRDQGLSQAQAESVADQEVTTGEYLTWKF